MTTITSLGANDSGSTSRGVINTNFTNLNTDKLESSVIQRIYKSADETVNGSDVLQDDNELVLALGVNEVWAYKGIFHFNSGGTPDIKFYFNKPSGTTFKMYEFLNLFGYIDESSSSTQGYGGSSTSFFYVEGIIQSSSTAGNFTVQWAQNTSNASDTKLLAGSYIIAHKLA